MTIVFLDTEFTDLIKPELLSIGLVSLKGAEHYVEFDLTTDAGKARFKKSSEFVKYGGVLEQWGLVPGAAGTLWEMGRRTSEWLLAQAAESGTRVEVAFDYPTDFHLLEDSIRECGLLDRVREVVVPIDIDKLTSTIDGELAAEGCFRSLSLSKRCLRRHHALADALALRAAYIAVKRAAVQRARELARKGMDR